MNRYVKQQIITKRTAMEIYPHSETIFHYVMGILSILIVMPFTILFFPVMLILGISLNLIFYPFLTLIGGMWSPRIWNIKNRCLQLVHYTIYRILYAHIAIWLSSITGYDDYWYGLDLRMYRDHRHYMSSFRNSRVRWRFKNMLKRFALLSIDREVLPDHDVFFRILFSVGIIRLLWQASVRKNEAYTLLISFVMFIRDSYLLLFLPVRVHLYTKDREVVGLASYLRKGNTLIMCQHIIADSCTRSGMFYHQMEDLVCYAFDNKVEFVSCSITTGQSKLTSGFHPIDFRGTDEFRVKPFLRLR